MASSGPIAYINNNNNNNNQRRIKMQLALVFRALGFKFGDINALILSGISDSSDLLLPTHREQFRKVAGYGFYDLYCTLGKRPSKYTCVVLKELVRFAERSDGDLTTFCQEDVPCFIRYLAEPFENPSLNGGINQVIIRGIESTYDHRIPKMNRMAMSANGAVVTWGDAPANRKSDAYKLALVNHFVTLEPSISETLKKFYTLLRIDVKDQAILKIRGVFSMSDLHTFIEIAGQVFYETGRLFRTDIGGPFPHDISSHGAVSVCKFACFLYHQNLGPTVDSFRQFLFQEVNAKSSGAERPSPHE